MLYEKFFTVKLLSIYSFLCNKEMSKSSYEGVNNGVRWSTEWRFADTTGIMRSREENKTTQHIIVRRYWFVKILRVVALAVFQLMMLVIQMNCVSVPYYQCNIVKWGIRVI